jgi:hypothetical protein
MVPKPNLHANASEMHQPRIHTINRNINSHTGRPEHSEALPSQTLASLRPVAELSQSFAHCRPHISTSYFSNDLLQCKAHRILPTAVHKAQTNVHSEYSGNHLAYTSICTWKAPPRGGGGATSSAPNIKYET